MSEPIARNLRDHLERLRADFASTTGRAFAHFYCPVLHRDEDVRLCKAHVVNQAFPDASKAWTVQRADVDSYFGSLVEGDFTVLGDAKNWSEYQQLADRRLIRRLNPSISVDGRPIEFYVPRGRVPESFTLVGFDEAAERPPIALKMSSDELMQVLDGDWKITLDKDLRFPALVALIKSAFLTKFALLGYTYALSPAGRYIGQHLLGRFYSQVNGLPMADARAAVEPFFSPYSRMLRPVESEVSYQGTIEDGRVLLCRSPLGFFWGSVVFVRGAGLHSVLLPVESTAEALATFENFISSENELLEVRDARFVPERQRWEVSRRTESIRWPR